MVLRVAIMGDPADRGHRMSKLMPKPAALLRFNHMLMGMSVTSTGVDCVFLTVTVSTPLSNRAVMPLMSALSGSCRPSNMHESAPVPMLRTEQRGFDTICSDRHNWRWCWW